MSVSKHGNEYIGNEYILHFHIMGLEMESLFPRSSIRELNMLVHIKNKEEKTRKRLVAQVIKNIYPYILDSMFNFPIPISLCINK